MNKEPLVSIITPLYNSSKYVEETIHSVLNQCYQNWEWLVVDDVSTDNSVILVKKHAEIDSRIKIFESKVNRGSGFSRNIAIDNAKGKYIAFLDSDDLWDVNKLSVQIKYMMSLNIAFSYTSYRYIDESSKEINMPYIISSLPINYKFLLRKTDIGCLTVICDKEQLGVVKMPDMRRKEDYALWLSLLKKGFTATPIPQVLASYRVRKGSVTSNKLALIKNHYKFLKQTQGIGFFGAIYYTLAWGSNGFNKFFFSKIKRIINI